MNGNGSISFKDIFQQLSASALFIDQNGMIIYGNQAYFQLSGYENKDVKYTSREKIEMILYNCFIQSR